MADLIAPMPVLLLYYNCTAVFEAVDPVDGSAVSGVTVSNPALYGVNMLGVEPDQTVGTEEPAPLPLFVPLNIGSESG